MTYPKFRLGGMEFGGDDLPIKVSDFNPGQADLTPQDMNLDTADGVLLGRDYMGSATWSFDIYTDVHDHQEALDLEGSLAAVWLDPDVRTVPGSVVPLDYSMIPGVWKRVYGRPRRWAGSDGGGVLTALGRAEMTADFLVVDHKTYSAEERTVDVGLLPASLGGFPVPFVAPWSSVLWPEGGLTAQAHVQGSAPTWPVITFHGPVRYPAIEIGDRRLELNGVIARDYSVTIDTAPWARSAIRSDGAPVGGILHASTRLSEMYLKPGFHRLSLSGLDETGTARATLTWRDAYYTL